MAAVKADELDFLVGKFRVFFTTYWADVAGFFCHGRPAACGMIYSRFFHDALAYRAIKNSHGD